MKFEKIKINGFKSFLNHSTIDIYPGLTGIVGPNGCGKSNLVEAITWVMGETSYKNMRTPQMDEVIFSGTHKHASRNIAEVKVLLSQVEDVAPIAFKGVEQLEISRRIERSEGSHYTINSTTVRARDVQTFFADGAMGAHSSAIIKQGRISEIITGTAQQLRSLLDEAAGIKGLHMRRQEVVNKLNAAQDNLTRLQDVTTQMQHKISELDKQSLGASKYKKYSIRIRGYKMLQKINALAMLQKKYHDELTGLKNIEDNLKNITIKASDKSKKLAQMQDNLQESQKKENEYGIKNQVLLSTTRKLTAVISQCKQQLQDLQTQKNMITQSLERETLLCEEAEEKYHHDIEEYEKQKKNIEKLRFDISSSEKERVLNQKEYENKKKDYDEKYAIMSKQKEKHEKYHYDIAHVMKQIEILKKDQQELNISYREKEQHNTDITDNVIRNIATIKEQVEKHKAKLVELRESFKRSEQKIEHIKSENDALKREEALLSGKRSTLEKFIAGQVKDTKDPIIDILIVNKGFEKAVAAALGEAAKAGANESEHSPFFWCQTQSGQKEHLENIDFVSPIQPLAPQVRNCGFTQNLFNYTGYVRNWDEGQKLRHDLRPGQCLVSLQGDFWRWDGLTARNTYTHATAHILAAHNELKQIIEKHENILRNSRQTEEQHKKQNEIFNINKQELAECSNKLESYQHEYFILQEQLQKAEKITQKQTHDLLAIKTRIDVTQEELKKSENLLSTLQEKKDTFYLDKKLEEEVQKAKHVFDTFHNTHITSMAQLEHIKHNAEQAQLRLVRQEKEVSQWLERQKMAKEHINHAQLTLAEIENKKIDSQTTLAESEKKLHDVSEQSRIIASQYEVIRTELLEKTSLNKKINSENTQLEKEYVNENAKKNSKIEIVTHLKDDILLHFDECNRVIQELYVDDASLQRILDYYALQRKQPKDMGFISRYLVDITTHYKEHIDNDININKDELDKKLAHTIQLRQNLGAVNLLAEKEKEDKQKEYDSFKKEIEDLQAAIDKLRTSIDKINGQARRNLTVALQKMQVNLDIVYRKLFPGGIARLSLQEGEDILVAPLVISAAPMGKNIKFLHLLSGGEQTLTALALIFAVFLFNPPPLCLLDEVDAPLDDMNTERFCNLLEEIQKEIDTCFLIVTHNAYTMARMHRLYGVTMIEKGVSQIVSVNLETAYDMRDAS